MPLALEIENFIQLYKFGASSIDSSFDQGDWMVLVDNNLNMNHQFSAGLMGLLTIWQQVKGNDYSSVMATLRPHPGILSSFWLPNMRKTLT